MTVAICRFARSSTITPAASEALTGWSRPAKAERRANMMGSGMEPRSFRIDEDAATDLDLDIAAAHRIVGAHALADALRPAPSRPSPIQEPSIGENATEVM